MTVRLPWPLLVKVASRSVSAPRNSAVTGTFSSSASLCSVVSEQEVVAGFRSRDHGLGQAGTGGKFS